MCSKSLSAGGDHFHPAELEYPINLSKGENGTTTYHLLNLHFVRTESFTSVNIRIVIQAEKILNFDGSFQIPPNCCAYRWKTE